MPKNVRNGVYVSAKVVIDDTVFKECVFDRCMLHFQGGDPPSFESCRFQGSQFMFDGPAANTLVFLRGLARPDSGLQPIVREMFEDLFK